MSLRKAVGLGLIIAIPLAAQEGDALPTEYVVHVPPGAWLDLDTGILLPRAEHQRMRADLRFGRDGRGFYLEPLHGGMRAARDAIEPDGELATERLRIGRHDQDALIAFARTDRGMARVELMVTDTYSTGSAALRFVLVPNKQPRFLPAPTDLQAAWEQGELVARWRGDYQRWHVVMESGDQRKTVLANAADVRLGKLDDQRTYHITVRGMLGDGTLSLPIDVVQHGRKQLPRLGEVEFAGRWYDQTGGLNLTRNEVTTADADVVFYLYGVHVPGGGVMKLGTGSEAFRALHELPPGPFPPTYGRLDDHDVLVVRTADGRYAKLWLEPMTEGDVRDGMRVHSVWFGDGSRRMLATPEHATSTLTERGTMLQWEAVPNATGYRVTIVGRPEPILTKTPSLLLGDLAKERAHAVQIRSISAHGEVSQPCDTIAHTYSGGVRMGRLHLRAMDGGFDFVTGEVAAKGDLQITGGAGGATVLQFTGQIAPGGEFEFGELPPLDRLRMAETWSSDQRKRADNRCYVRTRDGGLASVRIVTRGWPESELEYLWRPGK